MKTRFLVAIALSLSLTVAAHAQYNYSLNYQTNTINVTSNWVDNTNLRYVVGSNTFLNALIIQNGGALSNGVGYIGYLPGGSNNAVLVTGPGSVWSNNGGLVVGNQGAGNVLIITNGGAVFNNTGTVGNNSSSSNSVLVSDPGSVWNNSGNAGSLYVGSGGTGGAGNSLVVSNHGAIVSTFGYVGFTPNFDFVDTSDRVLVTDTGSVWLDYNDLYIGRGGAGNSLVIRNGGAVSNGSSYVGSGGNASNNSVLVTDFGSVWSNLALYVGYNNLQGGSVYGGNSLVISNQGAAASGQVYVGHHSDSNSVLVTGPGSVLSLNNGPLYVGDTGIGNRLIIRNQAQVISGSGYVGNDSSFVSSVDNSVLVSDPGSVWRIPFILYVGVTGSRNSLVISNQGVVVSGDCYVSGNAFSTNNSVLVTGPGSVWSNSGVMYLGLGDSGNSLVISNQGAVINSNVFVGYFSTSNSNRVRVADGAAWQNNILCVGYQGSSNSLLVSGGSVFATNLIVGAASALCNNLVQLDSGNITVTNTTGNAVLEVRDGEFILNGGTLQVDKLIVTNSCARFIRNGGTLIVGSLVLGPNLDADGDGIPNGYEQAHGLDPLNPADANLDYDGDGFSNLQEYLAGTDPNNAGSTPLQVGAIAREGDCIRVTWKTTPGTTNELQATGCGLASYSTNSFAAIFSVTNAAGSVTNYLDCGCVTNSLSRFYRIRFVP